MWEQRHSPSLLVGVQASTAAMEVNMENAERTENDPAIRPRYPPSGNVSQKENKVCIQERDH